MDQYQVWKYLSLLSPIILLIGLVVGFYFFKSLNRISKNVLLYLGLCLVVDLIYRVIGYYSVSQYNLFVIPIFAFLELIFFANLYYRLILKSRSRILFIFIVLALMVIFSELLFIDRLFQQKTFHSFGKVVADLTVIVFCITYYWRLLTGKIKQVKEVSQLNATFLIYYSVNLILFLPINFLVNASINIVFLFWVINLVSLVLFYLVLTYMIWRNGKTQKCLQ
jgi:hypothetical protein